MGVFKALSATVFEEFPAQLAQANTNPAMRGRSFMNNIFSLSCRSQCPNFALLGILSQLSFHILRYISSIIVSRNLVREFTELGLIKQNLTSRKSGTGFMTFDARGYSELIIVF